MVFLLIWVGYWCWWGYCLYFVVYFELGLGRGVWLVNFGDLLWVGGGVN